MLLSLEGRPLTLKVGLMAEDVLRKHRKTMTPKASSDRHCCIGKSADAHLRRRSTATNHDGSAHVPHGRGSVQAGRLRLWWSQSRSSRSRRRSTRALASAVWAVLSIAAAAVVTLTSVHARLEA